MFHINIDDLQCIPLFKTIDKSILSKLVTENNIYERDYMKGITVHNEKESCHTLDVVLCGSLVAYSLSSKGSSTAIFEFKKGSTIGANLLFAEKHIYPLNIYCLTNCKIIHIDISAILEFLHDYNFTLNYIKSISQNSQGMNQKLAMFTRGTLRINIMNYFREQAIIQNSSTILIPMSKKEFADYLGVQRPSLFRELKNLKEEGIIGIDNRRIIIKKDFTIVDF